MPNRIIKDTITESDALTSCSLFAQDLYKRLITYADDYGRFNADTMVMRARLYPREFEVVTEQDIIDGLIELAGVGKIAFYTPSVFNQLGEKGIYGAFPKWRNHQRVRNLKHKFPEPDDTSINDWYLRRFIPIDLKIKVIERDKFKCAICGKKLTPCKDARRFIKLGTGLYHIDHIVPVLQGGRATLENLRLTCPECNLKRSKKFTFEEIIEFEKTEMRQTAADRGNFLSESNPIQSNPNRIQSESESKSNPSSADETKEERMKWFDEWWEEYPRKVGKGKCRDKYLRIVTDEDKHLKLMSAIRKQNEVYKTKPVQYIPYPETWLNQERWEDELQPDTERPKDKEQDWSVFDEWPAQ